MTAQVKALVESVNEILPQINKRASDAKAKLVSGAAEFNTHLDAVDDQIDKVEKANASLRDAFAQLTNFPPEDIDNA